MRRDSLVHKGGGLRQRCPTQLWTGEEEFKFRIKTLKNVSTNACENISLQELVVDN